MSDKTLVLVYHLLIVTDNKTHIIIFKEHFTL